MIEQETRRGLRSRSVVAVEAPRGHQAGAEGLDQHVGALAERARELAVAVVREVERDRALVAVEPEVVGRIVAVPRRAPGARVVAAAGALDLDHVGAEVAERHRRERAREHAREVGDEQPVERSGGVGHRASSLVSEPMRTLVVSDLHLGSTRGADLLRRPELRAPLLEEVARHDRLVILGDARRAARGAAARRGRDRRAGVRRPRARARPRRRAGDRRAATTTTGSSRAGSTAACRPSRPASSASSSGSRRPTPARSPRGSPSRPRPRASSSPTPASGCATTSTRSTATTPTSTRPCRRSSASRPARWRAGSCTCPSTTRPPTPTRRCSRRSTRGCTRSSSARRTGR